MALNLSYESNPQSKFDLYGENTQSNPLIIFVHGGAWRTEDKADHAETAERIAKLTGCAVAVPNYRLSSSGGSVLHPEHSEDVLRFLQFIRGWQSPPIPFDAQRLYLIGHSCSAHMICSIFCDSSEVTPTLTPEPALVASVQGIIFTEGIFDLNVLLERSPDYKKWFVIDAFGDKADYASYSITRYPPRDPRIRWLIVHSKGDNLVDRQQSDIAIAHIGETSSVTSNLDDFSTEHDDILRDEAYIKLVANFVKDTSSKL